MLVKLYLKSTEKDMLILKKLLTGLMRIIK